MISTMGNTGKDILYAYTTSSDDKVPVVPVFLTVQDNTPDHFWKTFISALSTWNVQYTQRERQRKFPDSHTAYLSFFEDLSAELPEHPMMLVINDTQLISSLPVWEFLRRLRELSHSNLFVILLQNEVETPMGLVSKRRDISTLRSRYLSADQELELYRSRGFSLSQQDFSKLREVTDGWASAVDLMLEYLLAEGKDTLLEHLDTYLVQWSTRQYVSRYSDPEQMFLICLSLLDSFPLELVQYLTDFGGDDLYELIENSPFVRCNPENLRFRFASYLYPQFKQKEVLLDNKLRQDFFIHVGDWYRERGDRIEAMNLYRKARANQKMLKLMQQWVFPNTREVASCYIEAIAEMPPAFISKYPLLHIFRGHMLCTLSRYKDAHRLIERFCLDTDKGDETPQEVRSVLGEGYILWAHTHNCLLLDGEQLIRLYRRAAELLPNGSAMVTPKVHAFADAPILRLPSPEAGSMRSNLELLIRAEPYISTASGGWAGGASLGRAEFHFYTRNFKEVEENANRAIVAALEKGQYDIICSAYLLLMRFNFAKGNYQRTVENHQALRHYAGQANYESFFSMPDLADAWLLLRLGKNHEIADWLRDDIRASQVITPWNCGRDRIIHSHYLLEMQRYEEVVVKVDTYIDTFQKRGYHLLNLHCWMIKAVAYNSVAKWEKAAEIFEEVYHWSHANNIVMPVVEMGNHTFTLIGNYRRTGRTAIPETWLAHMETKARSYYVYICSIRKQYGKQSSDTASLLEMLNGKEQRLLLLLTKNMSLNEISAYLDKSTGAVKSMCHRLYTKLGVAGKVQAAQIGKENRIEELIKL